MLEINDLTGSHRAGGPGGAGDVHVHMIRHKYPFNNENIAIMHVYIIEYKTAVK